MTVSDEQGPAGPAARPKRRVTIRSGTSRGRDSVAVGDTDLRVETATGDAPPGPDAPPPAGCPCASGF